MHWYERAISLGGGAKAGAPPSIVRSPVGGTLFPWNTAVIEVTRCGHRRGAAAWMIVGEAALDSRVEDGLSDGRPSVRLSACPLVYASTGPFDGVRPRRRQSPTIGWVNPTD